jgi:hypothetical protein
MTLKHRQCEVHLHIYPFGQDVYVGWEAFLNRRQWGETPPVSSRYFEEQKVEFKEIRPADYAPSEFDWIDLRGLAELVHRRLEQVVRRLLKDRNIDMQLDFAINRSGIDKGGSTSGTPAAGQPGGQQGGLLGAFRLNPGKP